MMLIMAAVPLMIGSKREEAKKKPNPSFHFADLKKERCPQSWKMMNILTMNPAAGIDSARVIQ